MKDPEDEAFEELALKQGHWVHTSGNRKRQIMEHTKMEQAFPNPHRTDITGMTLRQYAAIKLKVPNSGTDWLDDMIRQSLRDDFAAKALPVAMEALCQDWTKDDEDSWYWNKNEIEMLAEKSYALADLMLKAREQ